MTRYKQRIDHEGFAVPSGEVYKIACCDCGLVHDFVFISEDGKPIGIAARRNNRATAQKRRNTQWSATAKSRNRGNPPEFDAAIAAQPASNPTE